MSSRSFLHSLCFTAALIAAVFPVGTESLRNQNKMYFDSVQWENTDELTMTPLPEAYTIETNNPVPYADTIDDGDVYPSLPQLGMLEYQNIAEDVLRFFDGVSAGLLQKSFEPGLFAASKPFLPHLAHFILERLPDISAVFYSRPVFNRDETVSARFRLSPVKPAAVPPDAPADRGVPEDQPQAAETVQAAPDEQAGEKDPVTGNAPDSPAADTQTDGAAGLLTLFDTDDLPVFIIMELSAMQEDGVWKLWSIDIRGAEYADSADSD